MTARRDHEVDLGVGPFHYAMAAADESGERMIEALEAHVAGASRPVAGRPVRRRCLLLRREPQRADLPLMTAGELPADVLARCPEGTPAGGWSFSGDGLGTATWWQDATPVCIAAVPPSADPCLVVLPWMVLLRDAFAVGGGVLHAGLAARGDDGALFLAPPDGGKSTTLGSAPAPWRVLGDDAALVWPEDGGWRAGPLPTWGYLAGVSAPLPGTVPWRLGESVRVRRAVRLHKGRELALSAVAASAAVREYYRAAAEHPAMMRMRSMFARELFGLAAGLARDVPLARLELTRGADHWPLLQDAATT